MKSHRNTYFCNKSIQISLKLYSDERDRIQKKTFTKWCNQHLRKVTRAEGEQSEIKAITVNKRNTLRAKVAHSQADDNVSDDDGVSVGHNGRYIYAPKHYLPSIYGSIEGEIFDSSVIPRLRTNLIHF